MLKALEILRDNYIAVVSDTDTEMALYYQDHIQIAIKELEELENRTCEGCKYEVEKDCKGSFMTVCKRYPRLTDRYESKIGLSNDNN